MNSVKLPSLRLDEEGYFHIYDDAPCVVQQRSNDVVAKEEGHDQKIEETHIEINNPQTMHCVGHIDMSAVTCTGSKKYSLEKMKRKIFQQVQQSRVLTLHFNQTDNLSNYVKIINSIFIPLNVRKLFRPSDLNSGWSFLSGKSFQAVKYIMTSHLYHIPLCGYPVGMLECHREMSLQHIINKAALNDTSPQEINQTDGGIMKRLLTNFYFPRTEKKLKVAVTEHENTEKIEKVGIAKKFRKFKSWFKSNEHRLFASDIPIRRLRNIRSRKHKEMTDLEEATRESKVKVVNSEKAFNKSISKLQEFKDETYDVMTQHQSHFKDRIKEEDVMILKLSQQIYGMSRLRIFKRKHLVKQLKFHQANLSELLSVVDNF